MDWGHGSAAQNLTDYIADIEVLVSHLEAARSVAVGLYQHNPDSRNVPSFEGLYDDMQAMCLELRAAKTTAKNRLKSL